jgi:hypothetical protein
VSQKIYHIVPPRVEGPVLMPLNQLKSSYPALYEQHAAKYQGREVLMQQMIPYMNSRWNDVLQFSPVHPEQIRDAVVGAGFGWRTMLVFEIDTEKAGFSQENASIFINKVRESGDFTLKDDDFEPYSLEVLSKYQNIPDVTVNAFKDAKAKSEPPLLFLWVPHVLFKGTIPVEKLKIIEVS